MYDGSLDSPDTVEDDNTLGTVSNGALGAEIQRQTQSVKVLNYFGPIHQDPQIS